MSVPGFSVTELLQALKQAKKIVDCFADEFESASSRVTELKDTLDFSFDILYQVQTIVRSYGVQFPGAQTFGKRLQETERFIGRYLDVLPNSRERNETRYRLKHGIKATWQTIQFSFDETAHQLNNGLIMEMQKLQTWILVSAWYVQPKHAMRCVAYSRAP